MTFRRVTKAIRGVRKWWCGWQHTSYWERVKPGHRRCTKCGFDYKGGWGVTHNPGQQKRLPK